MLENVSRTVHFLGTELHPFEKVEIFAAEDFYKQEKAKEQEFVGQIQRADKGGKAGFGRFNPYRLMVITYQDVSKETIVNGKVVRETVKVPYATVYEIYIAGKGELLEPFLGKEVKLPSDRLGGGEKLSRRLDMSEEAVDLLLDIGAGREQHGLLMKTIPVEGRARLHET